MHSLLFPVFLCSRVSILAKVWTTIYLTELWLICFVSCFRILFSKNSWLCKFANGSYTVRTSDSIKSNTNTVSVLLLKYNNIVLKKANVKSALVSTPLWIHVAFIPCHSIFLTFWIIVGWLQWQVLASWLTLNIRVWTWLYISSY
jgi:hypothetical protein